MELIPTRKFKCSNPIISLFGTEVRQMKNAMSVQARLPIGRKKSQNESNIVQADESSGHLNTTTELRYTIGHS